jgi:BASS family bile acid:Na+ symporter
VKSVLRFLKEWTLPVAIGVGTLVYLTFYWVPQLDELGDRLSPVMDMLFPFMVFLTLFITFCKVDFHQMRPHRWHAGVLVAQLLLVGAVGGGCWVFPNAKLVLEAILTCIIGPTAAAAPVVAGKLGGNISTMTTYTLLSSVASALMIPLVFPMLEQTVHVSFLTAFLIILQKVATVLLLPLVLGWLVQHHWQSLCRLFTSMPNLSFYTWSVTLSITTGITVKNIVHSAAPLTLLGAIAAATFVLCLVQFAIGRGIGRWLGEEINAGQALFQKNTALSIWVSYMYLSPIASIGAGCYVLWQNVINSIELKKKRGI